MIVDELFAQTIVQM